MIARVIQFIRHTPLDLLKEYFSFLPSATKIDWHSSNEQILKPLLQIIDELKTQNKESIAIDVDRISTMTDKLGQIALGRVIKNRERFYAMQNIYQRSLWAFLYDYKNFEKAEEILHADIYFKDSTWDGFIGTKNINIFDNSEEVVLFEEQIKNIFNIKENIKVEILSCYLTSDPWSDLKSFQIIIHYNNAPTRFLTFEEGKIVGKDIHPVEELIITYEPNNGQINIISKGKQCKTAIAKAFAQTLLSSRKSKGQISLMHYNLDSLRKPCDFITFPEDGIELVKVLYLLLQEPHNTTKCAIEVSIKQKTSIYTETEKMFQVYNPLRTGCVLISATLFMRFQPDKINRSGKRLLINIFCPNTCDLESNSLEDRLIINKYLKIWKLIEEL